MEITVRNARFLWGERRPGGGAIGSAMELLLESNGREMWKSYCLDYENDAAARPVILKINQCIEDVRDPVSTNSVGGSRDNFVKAVIRYQPIIDAQTLQVTEEDWETGSAALQDQFPGPRHGR
jgi:hypothetical protein